MSGEARSAIVNWNHQLDRWEGLIRVPQIAPREEYEEELKEILSTPMAHQRYATPEECWQKANCIRVFAAWLHRQISRERVTQMMAEEQISKLLAGDQVRVPINTKEERRAVALMNNQQAQEFESIRSEASKRVLRLERVVLEWDMLARTWEGLAQSKSRERY